MKRSYKLCVLCNQAISASNYERHSKYCEEVKKKSCEEVSYECDICGKLCNKHSLAYHKWVMHTEEGISWRQREKKGLTPEVYAKAATTRREGFASGRLKPSQKTIEGLRRLSEARRGHHHSEEAKKKLSEAIQKRYSEGWMPKAGRCKKIQYESPVAGVVTLDGTWELKVAKYLDSSNLSWTRNKKKFDYIDDKGVSRKYTPDFYIEEWKSYLEVKGYETPLDRSKWEHFPEKLVVWKEKELREHGVLR